MPPIKNDNGVYTSGYLIFQYEDKKDSLEITMTITDEGRVTGYHYSTPLSGSGSPLMDRDPTTLEDAIIRELRRAYTYFSKKEKVKQKFLDKIIEFGKEAKANPQRFQTHHFRIKEPEVDLPDESVNDYPTMEGKESKLTKEEKMALLDKHFPEQPTEETKPTKGIDFSKHIKEKETQFYAGNTVKCIDTGGLNSLFLGKEYEVEGIHTAVVGKNSYQQIRVYGLLYSVKYFILVS